LFSSLVIFVAKATRSDDIWVSRGMTASHPYSREKGVLPVGVQIVRQAQIYSLSFSFQSRLLDEMNFLSNLIIVLLNTSAKHWHQGYKRLKPHSKFGTYSRTDRILGLQIRDRCHE